MVSEIDGFVSKDNGVTCLNPCCCGRWSQRQQSSLFVLLKQNVLILVVVEDGLRGLLGLFIYYVSFRVLILVVVEDGLRVPAERSSIDHRSNWS